MKKVKLFCIPHAGGSAAVYYKWKKYLNKNIELCPIELAGRGRRLSEELYESLNEAIEDVIEIIKGEIKDKDDIEYMIYGHSMGCTIAYEVCCALIEDNIRKPIHLFLSGRHCPFINKKSENIYKLDDIKFKEAIMKIGGTPEEVFTNENFRRIFVPIMRSDYKNIETFKNIHKEFVLPIPITVLNGVDDELSDEEINGWGKLTSEEFKRYDFNGGHFFLHEHIDEVVEKINEAI